MRAFLETHEWILHSHKLCVYPSFNINRFNCCIQNQESEKRAHKIGESPNS